MRVVLVVVVFAAAVAVAIGGPVHGTPTVTVTPALLQTSGQNATVSVKGVSSPSKYDFLALYLASDDPTATYPIKYATASNDPNYMKTGSASFIFTLLNMRDNLVVYFCQGSFDAPVVVASSNIVTIANVNEPLQGRLSYAENYGDLRIAWTTRDPGNPKVRVGITTGLYSMNFTADTYNYTREQMCGPPATTIGYRDPGQFHSAVITGLPASLQIFYRFGDDDFGWSEEFSAWTPPALGEPVNFVAFGDLGQHSTDQSSQQADEPPSTETVNGIYSVASSQQFLLHIGDISYARGYMSEWEEFHAQIQPVATTLPYMTGIGNHERDWPGTSAMNSTDSGGECGVAYETRFRMPRVQDDQPWYSFEAGVVHIIIMSTEHAFDESSPQYDFIMNDLANVNRTLTPWLVFAGHRPYYIDSTNYTPGTGDQTVAEQIRDVYEDALMKYKVDVVFGAHHHSYQRTCPVYKGACVSPGKDGYAAPVVVDIGMAGASNSQDVPIHRPEIYKVVDVSHYGFTLIQANATTWSMQYVRDDDGKIHDSFTLTKNAYLTY